MMTHPLLTHHPVISRTLRLLGIGLLGLVSVVVLNACDQASVKPPNGKTPNQPQTPVGPAVQPILFGAYTRGNINLDIAAVETLEQELDHPLDVVQWFTNFDHPWEPEVIATASANGRIPMITWQPNEKPLDKIVAGVYDDYIHEWAKGAKSYQGKVYIRLMPEMNGNWVKWSGNAELYIQAWKHVVDIFRDEGATNVKWIWAPNCVDEPKTDPAYFMESYYPGADYVDVMGISGFNWGTTKDYHRWRTYEQIFTEPYNRLTKIGTQDIWIVETASTELGGDKAGWVEAMFTTKIFSKVKAIIWFNESKETDWRVQSSQASLETFIDVLDETEAGRAIISASYLK
ncbi:MAG: glycoside hydrolase family 26 protein [Trueperaceae bacterium]